MMAGPPDQHDDHPDLLALARGQLSNTRALDAGDHLATCARCRQDLTEVVVGGGLLSRAASVVPPAALDDGPGPTLPPMRLPEAPEGRPGRRGRALALVAAAALLVGGVGGVTATLLVDDGPTSTPVAGSAPTPTPTPTPDPDRVAPLSAVGAADTDTPSPRGEVQMTTGGGSTAVRVLARDLPPTAAGEYYEAWLLDPATQKMLPLGVMAGTETTFRVADALVDGYGSVDLSLERDDGDPLHSSTSVLRGSYADVAGG